MFGAAAVLIGGAFTAILGRSWGLFAVLTIAALLGIFAACCLVGYFVLPRRDADKNG